MIYVGIDPGRSGGIAVLDEKRELVFSAVLERLTLKELFAFLLDVRNYDLPMAVLERVHSMPGQGHSGAFTFGRNVGNLEALLVAAEIPFDQVIPRRWQPAIGVVYPPKAKDTVRKNISKARAQELFPDQALTITHALADAMLIAEYCRRVQIGETHGEESSRPQQATTEAGGKGKGQGKGREEAEQARGREDPRRHTSQAKEPSSRSAAPRHGGQAHPRTR